MIDEKAFEAAWDNYLHNGIVAGESDCLREAIEAYESARAPDALRLREAALLLIMKVKPPQDYNLSGAKTPVSVIEDKYINSLANALKTGEKSDE